MQQKRTLLTHVSAGLYKPKGLLHFPLPSKSVWIRPPSSFVMQTGYYRRRWATDRPITHAVCKGSSGSSIAPAGSRTSRKRRFRLRTHQNPRLSRHRQPTALRRLLSSWFLFLLLAGLEARQPAAHPITRCALGCLPAQACCGWICVLEDGVGPRPAARTSLEGLEAKWLAAHEREPARFRVGGPRWTPHGAARRVHVAYPAGIVTS